jgi:hypothetical protein
MECEVDEMMEYIKKDSCNVFFGLCVNLEVGVEVGVDLDNANNKVVGGLC